MSVDSLKIAFQGERGAYSEEAAFAFWGNQILPIPYKSFKSVFDSVQSDSCSFGLIPIENSLAGSIHQNYDLLLRHELQIVGEIKYRIRHNLLALKGVRIEQIKKIYSHPQALDQCSEFIESLHGAEAVPMYDTAGSALHVYEYKFRDAAAIASARAAQTFNLDILKSSIENNHRNYTRFLVIARTPQPFTGTAKTSIVFSMKDIPGALFKALAVFALRDINLLKIESRPLRNSPWSYMFYLDFEGNLQDEAINHAINHLQEITSFLKILGSYPVGQEVD